MIYNSKKSKKEWNENKINKSTYCIRNIIKIILILKSKTMPLKKNHKSNLKLKPHQLRTISKISLNSQRAKNANRCQQNENRNP